MCSLPCVIRAEGNFSATTALARKVLTPQMRALICQSCGALKTQVQPTSVFSLQFGASSLLYHLPYSWLHYISATLFVFESDCTCCFRKHDGMKCDKHTGHLPQGPGIAPKPRQRFSLHLSPRNGMGFGAMALYCGAVALYPETLQNCSQGGMSAASFLALVCWRCSAIRQQHHSWRWSAGDGLQFSSIL